MKKVLPPETLRQLLNYEPETGLFFWRERGPEWFQELRYPPDRAMKIWNAKNAGKRAFCTNNTGGYLKGRLLGVDFLAHRVAWSIHFGENPSGEIDHINGNPADNRIANLRVCTRTQNLHNTAGSRNAASPFKGVYRDGKRWNSKIRHNGKQLNIGSFASEIEAAKAYDTQVLSLRGEFARTNAALGLFNQEKQA